MLNRRILNVTATMMTLLFSASLILASEPVDLGLLKIESLAQQADATQVLGHALARTDNRFLVAYDRAQNNDLLARGLSIEPLAEKADLEEFYLILETHRHTDKTHVALDRFGEKLDVSRDLLLRKMSPDAARDLAETTDYRALSLSGRKIPIKYLPPMSRPYAPQDYPTDTLTALVSQDSIYEFDTILEAFDTRYYLSFQIDQARDYIRQKFQDWGYDLITTPQFWYDGWNYNVMAVKPGYAEPDAIVVVGGHYDSIILDGNDPFVFAPGADDNASGTALTMELARVLANVPLRKTVIFIAFSCEEVGLVGSDFAAATFSANGDKVEVMFNADMVAHDPASAWQFDLSGGPNLVYRNLTSATATRFGNINPVEEFMGSSSDHYSFFQYGFNVVNGIETNFNFTGWHTSLDISSRLNFPYMTDVVKMYVASLAAVADGTYPVTIDQILDLGDGQSLHASWTDCASDVEYVVYYGTSPGSTTDSIVVPPGQCDGTITGLTDGVEYFIEAIGTAPNGNRAFHGIGSSETPYLYPRAPKNLAGNTSGMILNVDWSPSTEVDFSHYRVYRRVGETGLFNLLQDNVTGISYNDSDTRSQIGYTYRITAVDLDGFESDPSTEVLLYPATYDGGAVVIDEFFFENVTMPEQPEQEAWFDTVFSSGYTLVVADEAGALISESDVGRFSSLYWFDEDNNTKTIANSEAVIDEFLNHNTDMLLSGFRTINKWSTSPIPTFHPLYQEFQLSSYEFWGAFDFVGAFGQNGWPSVQIDPTRGVTAWKDIPKLTPRPGATVICTFDSKNDFPDWEGQPVGLAYDGPNGKRVLLAFPLWYLTPSSAQALIAKAEEFFGPGGQVFTHGDIDGSGTIGIADVTMLADHLYVSLSALPDQVAADVDGRPGVDLGDISYLVNYLFGAGPAPSPGPVDQPESAK